MPTGIVSKVDDAGKYCFVKPDDGSQEYIYAPRKHLKMDAEITHDYLGKRVEYRMGIDPGNGRDCAGIWQLDDCKFDLDGRRKSAWRLTGDWNCRSCGAQQIERHHLCQNCGAPKATAADKPKMPGDWDCVKCGSLQFGRFKICQKCGAYQPGSEPKASPSPILLPGWEQAIDPTSGHTYYANRDTGESSWTVPTAQPPPAVSDDSDFEMPEPVGVTSDGIPIYEPPSRAALAPRGLALEQNALFCTAGVAVLAFFMLATASLKRFRGCKKLARSFDEPFLR